MFGWADVREQARTRPVITTCRAKWEGGHFDGTERERLELLMQAAELGAERHRHWHWHWHCHCQGLGSY